MSKRQAPKPPKKEITEKAVVKEVIGITFVKSLDGIKPNTGPNKTPYLPIYIKGYDKAIAIYRKDIKTLPHPQLYVVNLMDNGMYFLRNLYLEEEMLFVAEKLDLLAPAYNKDEIEKAFGIK